MNQTCTINHVATPPGVKVEFVFFRMFQKQISEALTLWVDEEQREGTIGGG